MIRVFRLIRNRKRNSARVTGANKNVYKILLPITLLKCSIKPRDHPPSNTALQMVATVFALPTNGISNIITAIPAKNKSTNINLV